MKYFYKILLCFFIFIISCELSLRIVTVYFSNFSNNYNAVHFDDLKKLKILALGESTTDGVYANQIGVASWPAQLEQILNKKGHSARVYNMGRSAISSYYIAKDLQSNIDHYKPDYIITMMGINDYFNRAAFNEDSDSQPIYKNLKIYKLYIWYNMFYSEFYFFKKFFFAEDDLNKIISKIQSESQNIDEIRKTLAEQSPDPLTRAHHAAKLAEQILKQPSSTNRNLELMYSFAKLSAETGFRLRRANFIQLFYFSNLHKNQNCYDFSKDLVDQGYYFEPREISFIAGCISENPDELVLWKKLLKDQPYSINLDISKNSTVENYNYIFRTAQKNNIPYIVMQYPLRSISIFKKYFSIENQKKIFFISNQENFSEALKLSSFSELFVDNFAVDFGHATTKGNQLIAENVAKQIIDIINNKSK